MGCHQNLVTLEMDILSMLALQRSLQHKTTWPAYLLIHSQVRSVHAIVTTCNNSCRKVIFSQASLILSIGRRYPRSQVQGISTPLGYPSYGILTLFGIPTRLRYPTQKLSPLDIPTQRHTHPCYWYLVAATKTFMVGKRLARIILEYSSYWNVVLLIKCY